MVTSGGDRLEGHGGDGGLPAYPPARPLNGADAAAAVVRVAASSSTTAARTAAAPGRAAKLLIATITGRPHPEPGSSG